MKIVSDNELSSVLDALALKKVLSIDTETTGLRPHHGDEIFSIIIADEAEEYYFNFNTRCTPDERKGITPLQLSTIPLFAKLFSTPETLWILANAKFDMAFLEKSGCPLLGQIWDIQVMSRIENNTHMKYGLKELAERIGSKKLDTVEEYIKKYKLFTMEVVPGKKARKKNKMYFSVPLEIVAEYGCQDARVTYDIYLHQLKWFKKWNEDRSEDVKSLDFVIQNEMALTRVCYDIEKHGLLLNKKYVEEALTHELERAENAKNRFLEVSGKSLVDSNKALLESIGDQVTPGTTEKGNASFTEKALSSSDTEVAKILLEYRDATKRATSYYSNFLYHADSNGVVHCNIRQSATATGRFSISDPALQTLNSEDSGEWQVRKSFKPRNGFFYLAVDFKAFEFRAMLDTAGEKNLAAQIESGLDPHQATADMAGISRSQAKTLNFGLLYGMGVQKLADSLKVSVDEARAIKQRYFDALPQVRKFLYKSSDVAAAFGFVINRFGRPYFFPDSKFSYKAANCLIQGGTAEAIKLSMVQLDLFFRSCGLKSRIVLQIHDELLFEIATDELQVVKKIKEIMENAWPSKFHKMECSMEYSFESWGDLKPLTIEMVENGIQA